MHAEYFDVVYDRKYIKGANAFVVSCREMFCVLICQVCRTWCPENMEVALFHSVAYPMLPHVNGARVLLFDGVVGDTIDC